VTDSIAVTMPRLSDSMTEGTIARWLKEDGDAVKRGEAIVDIETDKATMAFEAEASGTLRLTSAEGESVAVGAPIALIEGATGAAPSAAPTAAAPGPPASATAAPPSPRPTDTPARVLQPAGRPAGAALSASPLARRTAASLGVDLASVAGSGPHARIFKSDVVAAANGSTATKSGRRTGAATPRRLAPRRAVVAETAAVGLAAIFVESEVAFTRVIELREQLRTELNPAPTIDDIIVKAAGLALAEHPRLNSSWEADAIVAHDHIDVAVAIIVDDDIVTPTITDADALALPAIAVRSTELIERARSGKLTDADLAPATFTVTNLGMYGTTRFTPLLDPPQAASLGVGAFHPTQTRHKDGAQLAASLSLVCDPRVAHAAHAAMFLESLAELLESPMRLLL
jgi:pyruvate dehydrogenase E2 component (dihydrolipoamide acetyltransferase)